MPSRSFLADEMTPLVISFQFVKEKKSGKSEAWDFDFTVQKRG